MSRFTRAAGATALVVPLVLGCATARKLSEGDFKGAATSAAGDLASSATGMRERAAGLLTGALDVEPNAYFTGAFKVERADDGSSKTLSFAANADPQNPLAGSVTVEAGRKAGEVTIKHKTNEGDVIRYRMSEADAKALFSQLGAEPGSRFMNAIEAAAKGPEASLSVEPVPAA